MISKFTINGYPVRLATDINWQGYWGTAHQVFTFEMVTKDAEELMAKICSERKGLLAKSGGSKKIATVARPIQGDSSQKAGELTLEFVSSKGKSFKFERCVLVSEGVPSSPFHTIIEVSDRRFYWPDNEIVFNANERRVSGSRRVVSEPGVPIAVEQIVDDVTYAKLSMNPATGKPWKALEVLKEVLGRVVGKEGSDWVINHKPKYQALVQDFVISDAGHVAVAKALSLLPGLDIHQAPDGKFIIDTRIPGFADSIIKGLGPPLIVGQDIKYINKSLKRAIEFHSLFEREIGYRFDFLEKAGSTRDENHPWVACVLKATDPKIDLTNGKKAVLGTYIEEELMLASWNAYLLATGTSIVQRILTKFPLNLANVNKYFIANLHRVYTKLGAVADAYDEVLGRYINEIKGSHRQQFIMNPKFVDACLRIELKNPGYIDNENGSEADSPIYSDYSALPTKKSLSKNRGNIQNMAFNFEGGVLPYETKGNAGISGTTNYLLKDAKKAQARASWVSQPLGIFRLSYKKEPTGYEERVLPSAIKSSKIPSGNYLKAVKDFNFCELTDNHKMNMIVALIPRVPNDDRRLHRVVTTPAQIKAKYGIDVGDCCKNPFEDRIPIGIVSAQYPYDESKHENVKKLLGIAVAKDPKGKEISSDIGTPINQEDLEDLSLAQGFAHYLPLMDHYAGTKTIPMRNDIPLRSEIELVNYTMTTKGALLTTVSCRAPIDASTIEPMGLLPQSPAAQFKTPCASWGLNVTL